MGKLHWYKRDPDAALGGMMGLTLEERGAYNTVLDLIYSHADRLPDDDRFLAGWCNCDVRVWRRLKDRLIELGKLTAEGGLIRNGRATSGVDEALSRVASKSEAAKTRWAKSRGQSSENNDLADAQPSNVHMTTTTTTTKNNRETPSVTSAHRADGAVAPKPDPKGTKLPEGWRPEGELRQWTLDTIRKAESQVSAGHELERFGDYWRAQPGAKGRKADWPATWRNWIRKAIEMEAKPNGSTQRSHQGATRRPGGAIRTAANFAAALGGHGGERRDGTGRHADGERLAGSDILDPAREP